MYFNLSIITTYYYFLNSFKTFYELLLKVFNSYFFHSIYLHFSDIELNSKMLYISAVQIRKEKITFHLN